ncbi:MAG TPA: UbiA family prenyltransferase [Longimicrobiaceae bacterium]|nr:UbiA family prenyltransferase [Longimicrobiaceae bacterium]
MTALRDALSFLARVNVLLALCLALGTAMVEVTAGIPLEPVAPAITFLTFFAIYSIDRAADVGADARTHPARAAFARRYATWLYASAAVAYVGALALAAREGAWTVAVALLPIVAMALYTFPFLPPRIARRVGFSRIKEVPVFKNLHVAATMTAVLTLLPVAVFDAAVEWRPILAAGAFLLVRQWINVVVFDVRDMDGDWDNGIRTLPVVLGRRRTLRLLHAANAAAGVFCIAAPLLGWVPPAFAFLALGSVYAWLYLRRLSSPAADLHFLCDVIADGELFIPASLVLLASG